MTLPLTQVTAAKHAVAQCLAEQRSVLDGIRSPLWHLTNRIAALPEGRVGRNKRETETVSVCNKDWCGPT